MPSTWGNGLPWREMPGTLCCHCNISRAEDIKLSPSKPGLGQGMMEYWSVDF